MPPPIRYGTAGLDDQGTLGPLLLETLGPVLARANARATGAGLAVTSAQDEFMAADDFFFSSIDLMNCCLLAREGDQLVGAACVNPYVGQLMYVVVREDYRRQGIGRALVTRALAELEARGVDHVGVTIPLAAETEAAGPFFAALGFTTLREVREVARALAPVLPDDEDDENDTAEAD